MYRYLLISILFLFSCNKKTDKSVLKSSTKQKESEDLFTVLPPEKTGVFFLNDLKESISNNGLFYEYYYNGGGVAVADFDNDDLLDIYFVNNTKSNKLYKNLGNMKFKDITKEAKAKGGYGFGTGVTVVDINNDGLMDIYYSKSGKIRDPELRKNELLINKGVNSEGIPVFENQASKYGLDIPNFTTQATFFDYDKDGDLDMFLLNHGIEMYDENKLENLVNKESKHRGNRLYNNNNGKFIDVTRKSNIVNTMIGYGLGVTVSDLNNDNWPDIYVSNDFSEKDYLYINNQDGTFKESSLESLRHISNFSMGNDIADINNDGLLDIMVVDMMSEDNYSQKTSMSGMNPKKFYRTTSLGLHHQYMYNSLQLNNGVDRKTGLPKFSDIAQISGVSSTDWSWAPLFFDMNNDGHKDLFISNGIKGDFRNNDFVNYRKKKQAEVIKSKKIEKESYIGDILSKMPNRKKKNYFYINNGDLTFKKVNVNQQKTNSNGAAYGDLDNDGDLDIIVNNSAGISFIYKNNSQSANNYLKVKLHGDKNNINAIGAKVELYSKSSYQVIENHFTRGFQSAMADALHFGLGKELTIDSVKTTWSNGTFQVLRDVKANQLVHINYEKGFSNSKTKDITDSKFLFSDITSSSNINHKHKENSFDDYQKEILLPYRTSRLGPALAVADVNADGLDDFFIGGAKGQSSTLYLQKQGGRFEIAKSSFNLDKSHEDVGAIFLDADNDGDNDLYVVSGGTEEVPNSSYYKDRFYENDGKGVFVKKNNTIPNITSSGLDISKCDFDKDGDIDLFIGTRVVPSSYGRPAKSYLLENRTINGKISFVDVTKEKLPDLENHGMITNSKWADINGDSFTDLILTSEWGTIEIFVNQKGVFTNKTEKYGLSNHLGWWNTVEVTDIDNDGDLDLIAGNLGLNYKYKASFEKPFYLYLNDFDNNGVDDIVLGFSQENQVFPVRGRECSSSQMPFIKKKFKTYNDYGSADLNKIYGEKLNQGLVYKATNFATSIVRNNNGKFEFEPLVNEAQLSSVNKIIIYDYNKDNEKEILLLGNLEEAEVETPRNDASYGKLLVNRDNKYVSIPNYTINLWEYGDIKDASLITINGEKAIIIARNNDRVSLIKPKVN